MEWIFRAENQGVSHGTYLTQNTLSALLYPPPPPPPPTCISLHSILIFIHTHLLQSTCNGTSIWLWLLTEILSVVRIWHVESIKKKKSILEWEGIWTKKVKLSGCKVLSRGEFGQSLMKPLTLVFINLLITVFLSTPLHDHKVITNKPRMGLIWCANAYIA